MLIPFLFWVSILFTLLVSLYGVWKNIYWLVLLGAVLALPLAYYLNGSPNSHGLPILLPFFQVGSAAAVREGMRSIAFLLLLPLFFVVMWFLGVVLFYHAS